MPVYLTARKLFGNFHFPGWIFIIVIVANIIIASITASIASRKGRSGLGWFLLSFLLLNIIGLIIVLFLPDVD